MQLKLSKSYDFKGIKINFNGTSEQQIKNYFITLKKVKIISGGRYELIVKEIIETEKHSYESLKLLEEGLAQINQHLKKKFKNNQDLAQYGELLTSLSKVRIMLQVSNLFIEGLELAVANNLSISFTYKELLSYYFAIFTNYAMNHAARYHTFEKFKKDVKGAEQLLQSLYENPLYRGMTIENFMQAPVRRICKHPLLVKELQSFSIDIEEYEILDSIKDSIEKFIQELNKYQKQIS